MRRARAVLWLSVVSLCGCGYNSLQQQDEQVKTSWSEVVNQNQRRADLVASLASMMKGAATSEQALVAAAESRARSGTRSVAPAVLSDPAAFARYQALQDQLTQAARNLMGVSESYPQLQLDANFRDLRAQLTETEHRLAEARDRYVAAVRTFNTTVRAFPTDMTARVFDFHPRPNLTTARAPAGSASQPGADPVSSDLALHPEVAAAH